MYHYKSNYQNYSTKTISMRYKALFFVAVAAIMVLLFLMLTGVTGLNENSYIQQRNTKLKSETQQAQNYVNSLSRLGASSSSSTLGKIRQYIHGLEVINEINVGLYGEVGRLYSQNLFENMYSIIDEYESKLITGSKVNDTLSELTEAIENLIILTTDIVNNNSTNQ